MQRALEFGHQEEVIGLFKEAERIEGHKADTRVSLSKFNISRARYKPGEANASICLVYLRCCVCGRMSDWLCRALELRSEAREMLRMAMIEERERVATEERNRKHALIATNDENDIE